MSLFEKIKKVLTDYGFIIIISILGIAVLNFSFQKTCDDITFSMIGNTSVTALLKGALMQGNGRLLGNFFCYLIKYSLFTFIEKTVIWSGIVFLIIKIIDSKNIIANTTIAVLTIYPCDTIFSQVYGWNSGFQNYVFPVLLILFDVFLLLNTEKIKYEILAFILLILTSFTGQFFSENSSLFAVCLAVILLITNIQNKSKLKYIIAYFVSTFFGFILMMTYPHILGTSEKIASYRQYATSFSNLISLALKNYRLISKDFAGYSFLWIILSAAFMILIKNVISKVFSGKLFKISIFVSEIILIGYPIFSLIYSLIIKNQLEFPRYYFNRFLCISLGLYLITILFISLTLIISKNKQGKFTAYSSLLAIISVFPLLVVSPVGARTFYIIFLCFFISGMMGIKNTIEQIKPTKIIYSCGIVTLICVLSVLIMAETDNRYCYNIREKYLNEQIEADETNITLPLLPHQNLVHDDSNSNTWQNYIKNKYNKTIEIDFIEWDKWYQEYYK